MTKLVEINGKQCDLEKAFPIKLGTYKKLLKEGIDPSAGMSTLDSMRFMEIIIGSANPEITEDDCDTLEPSKFTEISNLINTLATDKKEAIGPLDGG